MDIKRKDFVNAESLTKVCKEYLIDFSELKDYANKEGGSGADALKEFTDKQYDKLKADEEFIKTIDGLIDNGKTTTSICTKKKYTYKAIEKFLRDDRDFKDINVIEVLDDDDEIADLLNDSFFKTKEMQYKYGYANSKLNDKMKDTKDKVKEYALSEFKNFTYKDMIVKVETTYDKKSVSRNDIINKLGEEQAKRLFPAIFKTKAEVTFDFNKLHTKGKQEYDAQEQE